LSHHGIARPDPWHRLRQLTPARIALGRAGASLPTAELLDFQLAHGRARDAVHAPFDAATLAADIEQLGLSTVCLSSTAADREEFLKRPDLGRRLDAESRESLLTAVASIRPCASADETACVDKSSAQAGLFDVAIIVSDGLSAQAAHRQVVPLIEAWLPLLRGERWRLAPVSIIQRGRVAIEDEIGELLEARLAVILIGERPGLGSPDSLGAYLVYAPRLGRTDAQRNCLSNIRPQGLAPEAAALKLHYLVREVLARSTSGVTLKDESIALGQTAPEARIDQRG
jgi:ethanolamine ammonia-lyase small subunit